MAEAPNYMTDEEADEWLVVACDECGVDNEMCECIACTECLEFGPGALTKDQNLTLCENCAEEMEVELINLTEVFRGSQVRFTNEFRNLKEEE